jgi:hypothetical protein
MLQAIIPIIGSLLGKAIDRAVPDADQAARLKAEVMTVVLQQAGAELQGAVEIIKAEAQGESWLQRNWRPLLMLTVVAIVGNNYLLAPYVNALFGAGAAPVLDLPDRLWDLMTLGVGGYVAGRTAEKVVATWKGAEK